MIKRADSARGAPVPLRISCRVASSRSHGRILAHPPVPSLSRCIESGLSEPVVPYSFKSAPLLPFPSHPHFPSPLGRSSVTHVKVVLLRWRRLLSNRPSILGQFDARPPPLHQAKLGTERVAKH